MIAEYTDVSSRSPAYRSGYRDALSDPPPDHDIEISVNARLDDILRHGNRREDDAEYCAGYQRLKAARHRY